MVRYVLKLWIDLNASFARCLPPAQQQRLDAYLNTTEDFFYYHSVADAHGNCLTLLNCSRVSVLWGDTQCSSPIKYVAYVEYVPTRLLTVEKQMGVNTFSRTLLSRTRMDALNHQIVKNRVATAKPKWMEI